MTTPTVLGIASIVIGFALIAAAFLAVVKGRRTGLAVGLGIALAFMKTVNVPLIVALDGITDPRNLGAIVRSTAAFGGHGVVARPGGGPRVRSGHGPRPRARCARAGRARGCGRRRRR